MAGLLGTVSSGVVSQAGAGPGTAGRGAVQRAKENKLTLAWLAEPRLGGARSGVTGQALGGVTP